MPVVLEGTHVCKRCKKEFEWVVMKNNRQKLEDLSAKDVDGPPPGKAIACESSDGARDYLEAYCTHCDALNRIEYK
ncbi:MAG: hypothetical protein IKS19_07600 [Clostridia bacterium]|nr:hypothetical protein [Clostridia bacterium]